MKERYVDLFFHGLLCPAGHGRYWKQWRYVRTRIRNLFEMGTHPNVAVPMSFSRKGPWKCARTLAAQTGMTIKRLKDQGLLSVKELWVKIHYPTMSRN
jgi:RNA-directed DNA polymerase